MRLKYNKRINPGDNVVVGGWMILIDDGGKDVFGGILPTNQAAQDYARSAYRAKNWRVLPVSGDAETGVASISANGVIESAF